MLGKKKNEGKKRHYVGVYINSRNELVLGYIRNSREEVDEEFKPVKNIWQFVKVIEFETDEIPKPKD